MLLSPSAGLHRPVPGSRSPPCSGAGWLSQAALLRRCPRRLQHPPPTPGCSAHPALALMRSAGLPPPTQASSNTPRWTVVVSIPHPSLGSTDGVRSALPDGFRMELFHALYVDGSYLILILRRRPKKDKPLSPSEYPPPPLPGTCSCSSHYKKEDGTPGPGAFIRQSAFISSSLWAAVVGWSRWDHPGPYLLHSSPALACVLERGQLDCTKASMEMLWK